MADSEPLTQRETVEDDNTKKSLKHLDFVQVAAIYIIVCFTTLYEYAKENSGPLKSGVQTVEDTVQTVIGPVYEKFHDVPFELLIFVDRKVDDSITEVDRHVPSFLKQLTTQSLSAAGAVASEFQQSGIVDGTKNITKAIYTNYEPTAKELYTKYEPVAEQYAVSAWRSLNRLPLFPQVAQIMVPTVLYWCGKYNQVVCYMGVGGYTVAVYLPLIPVERIGKVFEGAEHGDTDVAMNGDVSVVVAQ